VLRPFLKTLNFGLSRAKRTYSACFLRSVRVISDPNESLPLFLDVMWCPPRVSSFTDAEHRARVFETDRGPLPTVGIVDLVELKKTQQPRDYPIIGRLVLAYMSEVGAHSTEKDLAWVADNIFSLSELKQLLNEFPQVGSVLGAR